MNFPKLKFEQSYGSLKLTSLEYDENYKDKLCKNIQLSKMMSIYIPELITTLESTNYPYYSIDDFKVADIFTRTFIDGYILNGDLCCVSDYENCENCQIYLFNKKLLIRLDKEAYYSLRAVHLTKFIKKSKYDKAFITFELDMTNEDVSKVKNELISEEIDKLNIKLQWKPADDTICSSSIAQFFSNMGYTVKSCDNQYVNNPVYSSKLYKLPSDNQLNDENLEIWDKVLQSRQMEILGIEDEHLCQETEYTTIKMGTILHYKGFISASTLTNLIEELQNIVNNSSLYCFISSIPYSDLQGSNPKSIIVKTDGVKVFK